jgi:hypothetical protein
VTPALYSGSARGSPKWEKRLRSPNHVMAEMRSPSSVSTNGPYHGGDWQVWLVTFKAGVTPYLLTSDEAVAAAQAAGDVTVTRAPAADFRCPIT